MGAIQVPGTAVRSFLIGRSSIDRGYRRLHHHWSIRRLGPGAAGLRSGFRSGIDRPRGCSASRKEAALLARGIVRRALLRTPSVSEFLLGLNLIDGVVGLDCLG